MTNLDRLQALTTFGLCASLLVVGIGVVLLILGVCQASSRGNRGLTDGTPTPMRRRSPEDRDAYIAREYFAKAEAEAAIVDYINHPEHYQQIADKWNVFMPHGFRLRVAMPPESWGGVPRPQLLLLYR